ncbi:MAG: DUF134 domain-containing protein [Bacilli bacterium]|nr:DUF134 domain-containing protein [Bacilli bacterium]MBN2696137.1 DUF134 domain-containing protein [Bacilli bacterium]
MPRPQKPRNVCRMPSQDRYGPLDRPESDAGIIVMAIDELETIRLLDYEGYNQEEAARQMNVARTTVQRIYNDARNKVADALVNGKQMNIQGGIYNLCRDNCGTCVRPRRLRMGQRRGKDWSEEQK